MGSKPVKVLLEGVCVLVGPVDRNNWDHGDVRDRCLDLKRSMLEKAEENAMKLKQAKGDVKKVIFRYCL